MHVQGIRCTFTALRQHWKLLAPAFLVLLAVSAALMHRSGDAAGWLDWRAPTAGAVLAALIILIVASQIGATDAGHAKLLHEHLELTGVHEDLRAVHEDLHRAHEELEGVHRKLREAHEEHDFALQHAPAAYMVVDDTGIVVEVNPAAEAMFLGSRASLEGVSIVEVIPRVEGTREEAMIPVWLREEDARGEFAFTRPDGTLGQASFALATGHRSGLFVRRIWIWDISEERLHEREAAAVRQQYIAERLAEEGAAMVAAIEESLGSGRPDEALELVRRHVELERANVAYAAPARPLPSRIAVREVLEILVRAAEGAPVELTEAEEELAFVADPAQVRSALGAILRFGLGRLAGGPPEDRIRVETGVVGPDRLRRNDTGRPRVYLSFGIDGPPLAEPDREKLFFPMFSTDGLQAGFDLAIARRDVKCNGGYIRVEKDRTEGIRIEVHLPVQ